MEVDSLMKILILGVGNAQIDAIEYCKAHGYTVLGCSYTNTEPGITLLNGFEQINITDEDAVLDYAKRSGADVVYSVGSDIAMPTVSYVSEKLGLPHFVSLETSEICNQKHRLREVLGDSFKGNISFICASSKEELSSFSDFPGIIKPVDSQGQRGVCRVDSLDEAMERFDYAVSFSREKKVILERFLDGVEVSVNSYFLDGRMVFCVVSDRISFEEFPGGIIHEHLLPSSLSSETQEKVKDLAERVAGAIGLKNGPCYYQLKVVDEEPYLLEVTPRLDGCHMWRLIRLYCGVDLLDMSFNHLINGSIDDDCLKLETEGKNIRTVFMCQPPDTEVKTSKYPDALYEQWYYKDGDRVKRMNGYMEKCGYRIEEY